MLPVAAMVQRVGSVSQRNPNSGSFTGNASWIRMLLKFKLIYINVLDTKIHDLEKVYD